MKAGAALLLILLLSGCGGSSPTHFYTLAPLAPSPQTDVGTCEAAPVMVHHVLLPATLDRQSIVRSDGAEQLEISDLDRWAAPLDGMIQHALAEDLRARLPPGRVLMPGDAAPPGGAAGLEITVQRFVGAAAGRVTLQVDWTLLDPRGAASPTHSESITAAASSPKVDEVVAAMSRSVATLSDRIAAVLRACPSAPRTRKR